MYIHSRGHIFDYRTSTKQVRTPYIQNTHKTNNQCVLQLYECHFTVITLSTNPKKKSENFVLTCYRKRSHLCCYNTESPFRFIPLYIDHIEQFCRL
jgi:hypothetical protein